MHLFGSKKLNSVVLRQHKTAEKKSHYLMLCKNHRYLIDTLLNRKSL